MNRKRTTGQKYRLNMQDVFTNDPATDLDSHETREYAYCQIFLIKVMTGKQIKKMTLMIILWSPPKLHRRKRREGNVYFLLLKLCDI